MHHVLIIHDDESVHDYIRNVLSARSEVREISGVTQGRAAVDRIRGEDPDIVFLGAQLASHSGAEIVEEIGAQRMPPTVFVSTGDEHALRAFDLAAVDYLQRPLKDDRFLRAFERALQAVVIKRVETLKSRYRPLFSALTRNGAPGENGAASNDRAVSNGRHSVDDHGYLWRIVVEGRNEIHIVPVEDIRYLTAEDTYVRIHTRDTSYLVRRRLYVMERRLDPAHFVRIHRSTIVQLDCVQALLQRSESDYSVRLDNGTTVRVSRSRQDELIRRLETGPPRPPR